MEDVSGERETRIIIESVLKFRFTVCLKIHKPLVYRSRYNDSLRSGRSGDRIPGEASVPPTVYTGHVAHAVSYKMSVGSFPGLKRPERGVNNPPHFGPKLQKE